MGESMDLIQAGIVRALCFYDGLRYAPTRIELFTGFDRGEITNHKSSPRSGIPYAGQITNFEIEAACQALKKAGVLTESRGRVTFVNREGLIEEHEQREALFPRKLRRVRRVARWLTCLSGVRFVALCNTTALAHARDEGDLDFFVITKRGTIWQTRGLAVLPFKLLRRRPQEVRAARDAVCLSFFVDDLALDLSILQLEEDDPYFRHWFLSLLPLYDDGVSAELWRANGKILERHPLARPWVINPNCQILNSQFSILYSRSFDSIARFLQMRTFPKVVTSLMNKDMRVVVNDHVLKFHVEDGREHFRELYYQNCHRYGVAP